MITAKEARQLTDEANSVEGLLLRLDRKIKEAISIGRSRIEIILDNSSELKETIKIVKVFDYEVVIIDQGTIRTEYGITW